MDEGVYRVKTSEDQSDKQDLVQPWTMDKVKYEPGNRKKQTYLLIAVIALAIALVVVLCALFGVAIGLGVEKSRRNDDVCTTMGCVQLSAQIASRLNMSMDPCEDFIEFACGGWRKNNVIPPGLPWYRMYPDEIQEDPLNVRQQKVLESGDDGGVEAVRKAMNFYQACMNTSAINALGDQPLYDLIRATGGWPLLGIPQSAPWDVNSSTFFYEKLHQSPVFFTYAFEFDDNDVSKYVLHFRQTEPSSRNNLIIQRNYDDASVAVAQAAVSAFLNRFGASSTANLTDAARAIVELDTQVTDILEPSSSNRNVTTLSEIKRQWIGIDIEGFVRRALDDAGYTSVDPNTLRYSINTPMYFQRLGQLLQNTPANVIMDYSKFYFLLQHITFLSGSTSRTIKPGDLTYCLARTEEVLPIALARPYVEQYVPKQTKEVVSMIVDYVVRSFRARVERVDWLSDISRQRSLEKLDAVLQNVAYPDQLFNDSYVNEIYMLYVSNATDFFGNNLRSQELTNRNLIRQWILGVDRREWIRSIAPTTINGFYQQSLNQFYLLLGIETEPTFNVDWPAYFNFGGFGSIVGHETTHGYDNNGQQFDQNGLKRRWWSNESQQEFNSRLTCFVEQYNNYSFLGVPVNGSNTLAENLADNGGIQTSFEAYRMMARESGKPQQHLPSLPYTPEQYFFIAWGQLRGCELATPRVYEIQRLTDPHSPGPGRVIGPLQNSEDFARVFNCPLGSAMNPSGRKRCQLW